MFYAVNPAAPDVIYCVQGHATGNYTLERGFKGNGYTPPIGAEEYPEMLPYMQTAYMTATKTLPSIWAGMGWDSRLLATVVSLN